MIVIIDYEVGNLLSIKKMLRKVGIVDAVISGNADEIKTASKLILPGVGSFDYGIKKLRSLGLLEILHNKVIIQKTPILGICLGAQLFTRRSEEGIEEGLGWIAADTVKFDKTKLPSNFKVPNMGWMNVIFKEKEPLFRNLPSDTRFYFVHSYHFMCDNEEDVAVTAEYGYSFTAGFICGNIFGMQFHPEKSHKYGMHLLSNFINGC